MTIVIYFFGVFLSFLLGRYTYRMMCKIDGMTYTYLLSNFNVTISLLSWVSFIGWIIIFLIEKLSENKNAKEESYPPKWM